MAVNGISGTGITGTLSNGSNAIDSAVLQNEAKKFSSLVKEMQNKTALGISEGASLSGVSSSQVARNHRLNGDYTQGFYGAFTSDSDKSARPQGFAANSKTSSGKTPVIDKTSELYAQSMEMENYMVKMMLSSMRNTVQKTGLAGKLNVNLICKSQRSVFGNRFRHIVIPVLRHRNLLKIFNGFSGQA